MQDALYFKPGDAQHGIVALLQRWESAKTPIPKEHAARVLEQSLVARDPNHREAAFVEARILRLAEPLTPEQLVEAFMNAWKTGAVRARDRQKPFLATLTTVVEAGIPEAQRNALVEQLSLEQYAKTVPTPSRTVLRLLQALRPGSRLLHAAHVRRLEQSGIGSESFDFLIDNFSRLDPNGDGELRQRTLEALQRAVEGAKWSGQVADDVVARAEARLERLGRKSVLAPVTACFGFLSGLLSSGN
mgnify:CR=1 FL=1